MQFSTVVDYSRLILWGQSLGRPGHGQTPSVPVHQYYCTSFLLSEEKGEVRQCIVKSRGKKLFGKKKVLHAVESRHAVSISGAMHARERDIHRVSISGAMHARTGAMQALTGAASAV